MKLKSGVFRMTRSKKICQFRFNIQEGDRAAVERALNVARIVNNDQDRFQGREWKGFSLSAIADYYLENINPSAVIFAKTMSREIREAEASGGPLSPKKKSELKKALRRRWTKTQEERNQVKNNAVVENKGRLYEAMLVAGARYLADILRKKEERDDFTIFERESFPSFLKRWERDGGYLCRVRGDPRTLTAQGGRPVLFIYMAADISMPIADEYSALMSDINDPVVEIMEVIPKDGADWEQPAIADGRVSLK